MIKLTRIDGSNIYLNHMNIQWIESIPDTTITVMNGARIIVKEKIEDVLTLIKNYSKSTEHSNFENSVHLFPKQLIKEEGNDCPKT
ncbi:flagellar FlbD family protein [Pigmentibacter ruber]